MEEKNYDKIIEDSAARVFASVEDRVSPTDLA